MAWAVLNGTIHRTRAHKLTRMWGSVPRGRERGKRHNGRPLRGWAPGPANRSEQITLLAVLLGERTAKQMAVLPGWQKVAGGGK